MSIPCDRRIVHRNGQKNWDILVYLVYVYEAPLIPETSMSFGGHSVQL